MAYQTSANVLVALAVEAAGTPGTAALAGAADAKLLRITDSPGLVKHFGKIVSAEKRDDGEVPLPRHGGISVDGSYNTEVTVGGAMDVLYQALKRSTWVAETAALTCDAGLVWTSLAAAANTLTLVGTGSFITQGFKKGDLVKITAVATNLNKIGMVQTVAANVLTFYGTPFSVEGADNDAALTIMKKLKTATTPTRRSFTIDQYKQDIDLSETFVGCRAIGLKLSFKPNAHATATWSFLGMDRTAQAVGTSPWFTLPPVATTGLALIADDSTICKNGAVVATFTGFDLDFTIAAKGEPVIGSLISPDIFDNDVTVSGQITGLRSDFANLTLYDADTEFEVGIHLHEPGALPQGCVGFYLPRCTIGELSAPAGGGDGAEIETLALNTGPAVAAATVDAGTCTISSSGA